MSAKNKTEVLINGKVYTMIGYENEDYFQKVATYINGKIRDFQSLNGYKQQPKDMKDLMLQLNMADDYFKAQKQCEALENELSQKDKEIYELKHDLINLQIKVENQQKEEKKEKE